jgi:hypothetical protein
LVGGGSTASVIVCVDVESAKKKEGGGVRVCRGGRGKVVVRGRADCPIEVIREGEWSGASAGKGTGEEGKREERGKRGGAEYGGCREARPVVNKPARPTLSLVLCLFSFSFFSSLNTNINYFPARIQLADGRFRTHSVSKKQA